MTDLRKLKGALVIAFTAPFNENTKRFTDSLDFFQSALNLLRTGVPGTAIACSAIKQELGDNSTTNNLNFLKTVKAATASAHNEIDPSHIDNGLVNPYVPSHLIMFGNCADDLFKAYEALPPNRQKDAWHFIPNVANIMSALEAGANVECTPRYATAESKPC